MSFSAADYWCAEVEAEKSRASAAEIAAYPAKIYVEPTSRCNLNCRTCMRNAWDEALGEMSRATFARVLDGARLCPAPLTIFFGEFGEPLFHPGIVEMVREAKATGAAVQVELITNGMLLTADRARALIAAGLDRLWVSLDGAKPESYADVRLGAALADVIANVRRLRDLRRGVAHTGDRDRVRGDAAQYGRSARSAAAGAGTRRGAVHGDERAAVYAGYARRNFVCAGAV